MWFVLPLLYCPHSILKTIPHKNPDFHFLFIWQHWVYLGSWQPLAEELSHWDTASTLHYASLRHALLLPNPEAESGAITVLLPLLFFSHSRVKKKIHIYISIKNEKTKDIQIGTCSPPPKKEDIFSMRTKNISTSLSIHLMKEYNLMCHYETTGQFSQLYLPVLSRHLNLWYLVYIILMDIPRTRSYRSSERANARIRVLWITHILTYMN